MTGSIGRYELQAEIGRGGFGFVYRAWDPLMRREVAVKLLSSAGDAELLARFDAEAGVTGRLRHKNIVTVYDYGHHDGLPYIVLELLQGTDLKDLLEARTPLTMLDRTRILSEVAEGLLHAHQLGIVHRDVKPANVMVLGDGSVKVMDFGIARIVSQAATRLTMRGLLVGTLPYMAPEQFTGKDADIQTDIFSYGVLCYELLGGKHPFRGDQANVPRIMYMIGNVDPPPLRELNPEVPEGLEAMVLRALAKPRELRYAGLEDALLDIDPVLIELKQKKASSLIGEVKPLVDGGTFDLAQNLLKQILELDPSNREGQQLRRQVQGELQRQSIRKRVDALVAEGNAHLEEGKFSEAFQVFESAAKLDTVDTGLRELMERARERQQATIRAAQVLVEAQRDLAAGHTAQAREKALEAARLDSRNAKARDFLREVEQQAAREERERRYALAIQRIEELRQAGALEQASAGLEVAEREFPGSRTLQDLRTLIDRALRYRAEVAEIDRLRHAGESQRALERANQLVAEFPQDPTALRLAGELRDESARVERARAVGPVVRQVEAALASEHFEEAKAALAPALARYPDEPTLGNLQRIVARALDEAARKQEAAEEAARKQREAEDAASRQREAEETARKQKAVEEAARQQREAEEAARRQREAEDAARKQKAAEEAARKQREAEEAARRQREAEDAVRKQKAAEEAARKQREAEEAARRQREAEDAARTQKAAEEAARKQREAEEAARRQREAEEAARKQKAVEEAARKQREAEEAARRQREAEEAARKQKAAEEAARKQREAEEAARRQREAEEAARKQKAAEEAARQQREEEAARRQREAEEAARKQKAAEEAARKQREAEEAARRQREAEEAARKQKAADKAARKQRHAPPVAPPEVVEPARRSRTPLYIAAAVVVVAAASVPFWWKKSPPPPPVLATLEFRTDPTGATLRIGDKTCTAPCTLELAPKDYSIDATSKGYKPLHRTYTVTPDMTGRTTPLDLPLEPIPPEPPRTAAGNGDGDSTKAQTGTLEIASNEAQAMVLVDNQRYGRTDAQGHYSLPLPVKQYRVKLEKQGFETPPESVVTVRSGETQRVTVNLKPTPVALAFSGAPPNAEVRIDNNVVGRVGPGGAFQWSGSPGPHSLRLSADGYIAREVAFTLQPGAGMTFTPQQIALQRVPSITPPPRTEAPRTEAPKVDLAAQQRAADEQDWSNARSRGTANDLRQYLAQHPAGAHIAEANQLIRNLEAQAAAANAASVEADRKAIRQTLGAFGTAYSQKHIESLTGLWPKMPAAFRQRYRDNFRTLNAVGLSLEPVGEIAVSGNTARVNCRITYTASSQGKTTAIPHDGPVVLEKAGNTWLIQSID